jgi:glyoxylase-like metal-dependent hydrolase (beta-lactamase superfamily II)
MRGPVLIPVGDGVTAIDTGMAGEPELNAVYLVEASEPCLVETGPGADGPAVLAGLRALGVEAANLAHVVVTHIHMDHAGGAGALLRAFPSATLWVHERGARHVVDPTRLVASTARTYGEERMHRLYGDTLPCPADRVRAADDGDRIALGDRVLEVLHTPGHASHHVALADDRTGGVFTGEALGSYLPWGPATRPALPPPEVDLEAALASIARLRSRDPSALWASHFGATPNTAEVLALAEEGVRAWSSAVEAALRSDVSTTDDQLVPSLVDLARSRFAAEAGRPLGDDELARYDALGSIRMNAQGLGRYWRQRLEAGVTTGQES